MKIILCSDMHGRTEYLYALLAMYPSVDGFVFAGDGAADFVRANQRATQFHLAVCGNCDLATNIQPTIEISFERVKAFITHGHMYGAKSGIDGLYFAAKSRGCSLVLYGHTHRALKSEKDGVLFVCPGALQNGEYAVLDFKEEKVSVELKTL